MRQVRFNDKWEGNALRLGLSFVLYLIVRQALIDVGLLASYSSSSPPTTRQHHYQQEHLLRAQYPLDSIFLDRGGSSLWQDPCWTRILPPAVLLCSESACSAALEIAVNDDEQLCLVSSASSASHPFIFIKKEKETKCEDYFVVEGQPNLHIQLFDIKRSLAPKNHDENGFRRRRGMSLTEIDHVSNMVRTDASILNILLHQILLQQQEQHKANQCFVVDQQQQRKRCNVEFSRLCMTLLLMKPPRRISCAGFSRFSEPEFVVMTVSWVDTSTYSSFPPLDELSERSWIWSHCSLVRPPSAATAAAVVDVDAAANNNKSTVIESSREIHEMGLDDDKNNNNITQQEKTTVTRIPWHNPSHAHLYTRNNRNHLVLHVGACKQNVLILGLGLFGITTTTTSMILSSPPPSSPLERNKKVCVRITTFGFQIQDDKQQHHEDGNSIQVFMDVVRSDHIPFQHWPWWWGWKYGDRNRNHICMRRHPFLIPLDMSSSLLQKLKILDDAFLSRSFDAFFDPSQNREYLLLSGILQRFGQIFQSPLFWEHHQEQDDCDNNNVPSQVFDLVCGFVAGRMLQVAYRDYPTEILSGKLSPSLWMLFESITDKVVVAADVQTEEEKQVSTMMTAAAAWFDQGKHVAKLGAIVEALRGLDIKLQKEDIMDERMVRISLAVTTLVFYIETQFALYEENLDEGCEDNILDYRAYFDRLATLHPKCSFPLSYNPTNQQWGLPLCNTVELAEWTEVTNKLWMEVSVSEIFVQPQRRLWLQVGDTLSSMSGFEILDTLESTSRCFVYRVAQICDDSRSSPSRTSSRSIICKIRILGSGHGNIGIVDANEQMFVANSKLFCQQEVSALSSITKSNAYETHSAILEPISLALIETHGYFDEDANIFTPRLLFSGLAVLVDTNNKQQDKKSTGKRRLVSIMFEEWMDGFVGYDKWISSYVSSAAEKAIVEYRIERYEAFLRFESEVRAINTDMIRENILVRPGGNVALMPICLIDWEYSSVLVPPLQTETEATADQKKPMQLFSSFNKKKGIFCHVGEKKLHGIDFLDERFEYT